ncbi:MAG: hypothetical protein ACYDG2_13290, partial [Ruminiclostridium sp.]
LATAENVIKYVGLRGGFKCVSFQFINRYGKLSYEFIRLKSEAEEIMRIFEECCIPVKVETLK